MSHVEEVLLTVAENILVSCISLTEECGKEISGVKIVSFIRQETRLIAWRALSGAVRGKKAQDTHGYWMKICCSWLF